MACRPYSFILLSPLRRLRNKEYLSSLWICKQFSGLPGLRSEVSYSLKLLKMFELMPYVIVIGPPRKGCHNDDPAAKAPPSGRVSIAILRVP